MRRKRPSKLAVAVLCLAVSGCAHLTPQEARWLDQYRTDPNPPMVQKPYSTAAAGWLSVAFPGAGFFYLGEYTAGSIWGTVGLPLWIFLFPAARAAVLQAKTLNNKAIAEEYHRLRPRGWGGYGAGGGAAQTVNVQLSAPPVVAPTIVQGGQQQAPAPAPAPAGSPAAVTSKTPAYGARDALFCPHCGARLPKGAEFCPQCGKAIHRQ